MATYQILQELDVEQVEGGGRVAFCGSFGDDLDVVNVAYVSTDKYTKDFTPHHERFEQWLWDEGHTSPFRHQHLRFRVTCPIFVARQWMKHTVGSAWNERSGRYVEFDEDYWMPAEWREGSDKIKQGSLGRLDKDTEHAASLLYESACASAISAYYDLLKLGVCKEQARAVLPVSMMTELVWTVSLQALLHFFTLRLDKHAQREIQVYAQAVYDLVKRERSGAFANALGVIARD
jgi:thymidylate synthase (FAD)